MFTKNAAYKLYIAAILFTASSKMYSEGIGSSAVQPLFSEHISQIKSISPQLSYAFANGKGENKLFIYINKLIGFIDPDTGNRLNCGLYKFNEYLASDEILTSLDDCKIIGNASEIVSGSRYQDSQIIKNSNNDLYYENGSLLYNNSSKIWYYKSGTQINNSTGLYWSNGKSFCDKSNGYLFYPNEIVLYSNSNKYLWFNNGNTFVNGNNGDIFYRGGFQALNKATRTLKYNNGNTMTDSSSVYYPSGSTYRNSSNLFYWDLSSILVPLPTTQQFLLNEVNTVLAQGLDYSFIAFSEIKETISTTQEVIHNIKLSVSKFIAAPINLALAKTATTKLTATWDYPTSSAVAFQLSYARGSSVPDCSQGVNIGNTKAYVIENLVPAKLYTVAVCARDNNGNLSIPAVQSQTTTAVTGMPNISGLWKDNLNNNVFIQQTLGDLTLTYSNSKVVAGAFTASNQLSLYDIPIILGTMGANNASINLSNGMVLTPVPFTVPDLSGNWVDNNGKQITIQQSGKNLTFVYAGNVSYPGLVVLTTELNFYDGGNLIVGTISTDASKVNFKNGITLTRTIPVASVNLAGNWIDTNGKLITIQQSGTNLTFIYAGNVSYPGQILSPTQLNFYAGSTTLTGAISTDQSSVKFNNGITIVRTTSSNTYINIAGNWVDNNGKQITVQQTGANLKFIYAGNVSYNGIFTSSTQLNFIVSATNTIVGTVNTTGTRIQFQNGIVMTR